MFFASFVIACSLTPIVDKMSKKLPRGIATELVTAGILILILLIFVPVCMVAIDQISIFIHKLPNYIDNFDEDEENILTEMEQLIKLVNDNSKKINVIFSGESIFLKKKFELFMKERNFEATIEKQILFLYYIQLIEK